MEELNPQEPGITFEEALRKLEELVAALEKDGVGLEESLKCYEEGMSLAKLCLDRLDHAEQRVRELSLDSPERSV